MRAEPLVAVEARRLVEREVDLHLGAAVAEAASGLDGRGRHVGCVEQAAVELRRRHVGDDAAGRDGRAAGDANAGRRARSRPGSARRPAPSRARRRAARTIPASASTSFDAAALRHRHAAELDRDRDHLGHEPRDGRVRPEARVQHPGREQAVRPRRRERLREPVARRDEHVAGELDEPAPPEPPVGLEPEPGACPRPELGRQDAEGEVGVRHEALHDRLHASPSPGARRSSSSTFRSCDVVRKRGLAVRAEPARRQLGVQVLEPEPVQLVGELRVRGRADEQRVPGRDHLVDEAGLGDLRRPDRPAEAVGALEHEHALPAARQQRRSRPAS